MGKVIGFLIVVFGIYGYANSDNVYDIIKCGTMEKSVNWKCVDRTADDIINEGTRTENYIWKRRLQKWGLKK